MVIEHFDALKFYQINLSFFAGFKCHFLTFLQTNQLLRAELVQLDLHKDLSRIKMQQVSENGSNFHFHEIPSRLNAFKL